MNGTGTELSWKGSPAWPTSPLLPAQRAPGSSRVPRSSVGSPAQLHREPPRSPLNRFTGAAAISGSTQSDVQELDFTFDGKFSFKMEQMYMGCPVLNSGKKKPTPNKKPHIWGLFECFSLVTQNSPLHFRQLKVLTYPFLKNIFKKN